MTNESGTMTRTASELDAGSRVVHEGTIKTVRAVQDISYPDGRMAATMSFTDGSSTICRLSARFVAVCE